MVDRGAPYGGASEQEQDDKLEPAESLMRFRRPNVLAFREKRYHLGDSGNMGWIEGMCAVIGRVRKTDAIAIIGKRALRLSVFTVLIQKIVRFVPS